MGTIKYKGFSTSVFQLPDGKWIANYGRSDGSITTHKGKSRARWTTEAYSKREDAINQAYAAIDVLVPD